MTPDEYLDAVVRPNVAEMQDRFSDFRANYNAVMSVDSLAAHLFAWLKSNKPSEAPEKDDSVFRDTLARRHSDFGLLRDVAKALKHVELLYGKPSVRAATQIEVQSLGWGQGGWNEGRWGGPPQVTATLNDSSIRVVEVVVSASLHFLESEMRRHGLINNSYQDWRADNGLPSLLSQPSIEDGEAF